MPMEQKKISFCTVSMNRLHHLIQTLPANITNNKNYPNIEFILLDYNSSDGLESYIKSNFLTYIKDGTLVYYKTFTPQYFHRSHSRNLVFKLASGELICNIDADNFTGKNFAHYINDVFKGEKNIFLTTIDIRGNNHDKDVLGRICIKKQSFLNIKGYDERMANYGFEDYDFINRLELSGIDRLIIKNHKRLLAIKHGLNESISNEFVLKNLNSIMVRYLNPSSTEILFLFNNGNFKNGVIIDNDTFEFRYPLSPLQKTQVKFEYSLYRDDWETGSWNEVANVIYLIQDEKKMGILRFSSEKNCFTSDNNSVCNFYKLSDEKLKQMAIMLYSQISNRIIMSKNKLGGLVVVNDDTYGNGIVYKNFDYQHAIIVE
jgi:hypothetical protein